MIDTLAKIFEDGGKLESVKYTLFGGDPKFITAVGIKFESLWVVFRAMPDDDTLVATLGNLEPDEEEKIVESTISEPWQKFIGLSVCWAWQLTNQFGGGADGVRLEFSERGQSPVGTVELIVMASAIHLYEATRLGRVVSGQNGESDL